MATRERLTRKERAAQTRQKVLDTAAGVFAEKPYDQVQMRDIALRAGVAHGVVFHYFENKRGLYLAVIDSMAAHFFTQKIPDRSLPPNLRLRSMVVQLITQISENKSLFFTYVRCGLSNQDDIDMARTIRKRNQPIIEWLYEIVGIPDTAIAPRQMVETISKSGDWLIYQWLLHDKNYPIEALVEAMVELIVGALNAATKLDPNLDISVGIKKLQLDYSE